MIYIHDMYDMYDIHDILDKPFRKLFLIHKIQDTEQFTNTPTKAVRTFFYAF